MYIYMVYSMFLLNTVYQTSISIDKHTSTSLFFFVAVLKRYSKIFNWLILQFEY